MLSNLRVVFKMTMGVCVYLGGSEGFYEIILVSNKISLISNCKIILLWQASLSFPYDLHHTMSPQRNYFRKIWLTIIDNVS